MDKSRKVELVRELNDKFGRSEATFLVEYQGLTVEKITNARGKLSDASVELKVVRNTLAELAVKGTDAEVLGEHFQGPVAVAFSYKDAAAAAKALTEVAKEEEKFNIKLCALGSKLMSQSEVAALSKLPSREVLLGQIAGTLNSVPTGLARVLSAVPTKLVYALKAVETQKAG